MRRYRLMVEHTRDLWGRLTVGELILAALAAILFTLGALLAVLSSGHGVPLTLAVGLICMLAGAAVGIQWVRMAKAVMRPEYGARTYPYVLKEKHLLYEYYGDRRMHQRKSFLIEAREDGLALFQDRYKWSGAGKCIVSLGTPGATLLNTDALGVLDGVYDRMAPWDGYIVRFDEPLRKGEQREIIVDWDLYDQAGTASPFYATTVHVPTERLQMRVAFHRPVTNAKGAVFSFATSTRPVRILDLPLEDDANALSWEIWRPPLGYRYVITWDWQG